MQTLWQDIRYGIRLLAKKPTFTAIAIITLALGIGANTAIFSVVNAVLLRPLPYAEPERLVTVGENDLRNPAIKIATSYPNFFDWREQNQSFEAVAVHRGIGFTMTGDSEPTYLNGEIISYELLALLGAKPHLGRLFTAEEEKAGGTDGGRALILSYNLWQKQFGGDPNILGRGVTLDRKLYTVIGVMERGFQFPVQAEPNEFWVTLAADSETTDGSRPYTERRGFRFLNSIARLKAGVSIQEAQAEMSTIAANLEKQYADNNVNHGALLIPLHQDLVSDYQAALWILLGAVGCVLLIACANVANLLLARATIRYKEMAVRAALGANRWRIVRQLLTESVLLSFAGGALGLAIAAWGLEALIRFIPEDLPRLSEIRLDISVLGFTVLISVFTGILFGIAPALQASKTDLHDAMKEGARGMGASAGRARLRSALVIIEVALSIILLIGAGLLGQSLLKLQQVDLGMNITNVLTASVELPESQYPEPEQQVAFYQTLLERVRTLPGVESASATLPLPMSGSNADCGFQIEGQPLPPGERPETNLHWITLDYFQTMKIPLLEGRDFTERDDAKAPPVIMVNETFARLHFAHESPIGKRVQLPFHGDDPPYRQIVGVVKDVKHQASLAAESGADIYLPYPQEPFFPQLSLTIRTQTDPRSLVRAVHNEVRGLDKDIALNDIKTMEQYLSNTVAYPRFSTLLFGLFAAVALLLSAIGLYGVMAYSVTQRTHEIGIRMALGAQRQDVYRMIVRQGMTLAFTGIVVGLAAAFWLTKFMASLLYQVSATDISTFVVVAAGLAGVALVACFVPARRATKVDPMVALRYE